MKLYEKKRERAKNKKKRIQCGSKTHVRFGKKNRIAIDTDKTMKKTN